MQRAAEPTTVLELFARTKTYPHHVAKPGEVTIGEWWAAEFPAFDSNGGRASLERAIEVGPWCHWQTADDAGRDRWLWPSQAVNKIEEWIRKGHLEAQRSLATQKRAEQNGIDVMKPTEKADPIRDGLRNVWRKRTRAGEDLAPCTVWIDEIIRTGRTDETMRQDRAATEASKPAPAPSNPRVDWKQPAPPTTEEDNSPEAVAGRARWAAMVGDAAREAEAKDLAAKPAPAPARDLTRAREELEKSRTG